jgi:hypothetical protein
MQRFGAKPMIVTVLLVLGIGLGIMSRATGNFWIDVLPASLVAAGGMSPAVLETV